VFVSSLATFFLGCGPSTDLQQVEGQRLLEAISEVRAVSRQGQAYREAVARLRGVETTHERVSRIQTMCVEAHEGVFAAEAEALNARRLLEEQGPSARETQESIERGQRLILEAEQKIGRCGAMSTALGVSIGYEGPEER